MLRNKVAFVRLVSVLYIQVVYSRLGVNTRQQRKDKYTKCEA